MVFIVNACNYSCINKNAMYDNYKIHTIYNIIIANKTTVYMVV